MESHAAIARPSGDAPHESRPAAPNGGVPAPPTGSDGKTVAYGGQRTCPVTGEEFGSMGPAVPVSVKGETVYVCCRGCASKVERDPEKYLAKVMAERSEP